MSSLSLSSVCRLRGHGSQLRRLQLHLRSGLGVHLLSGFSTTGRRPITQALGIFLHESAVKTSAGPDLPRLGPAILGCWSPVNAVAEEIVF